MMDFCISIPCFWLVGFGLMFGGAGAFIGGPYTIQRAAAAPTLDNT